MADSGTLSRLTAFWNNEVDLRDQEIRRLSGVNAQVIQKLRDLKTGAIDLSLIQIMEDGGIQILEPPTPVDPKVSCVQTPEPQKNGKKETKELADVASLRGPSSRGANPEPCTDPGPGADSWRGT